MPIISICFTKAQGVQLQNDGHFRLLVGSAYGLPLGFNALHSGTSAAILLLLPGRRLAVYSTGRNRSSRATEQLCYCQVGESNPQSRSFVPGILHPSWPSIGHIFQCLFDEVVFSSVPDLACNYVLGFLNFDHWYVFTYSQTSIAIRGEHRPSLTMAAAASSTVLPSARSRSASQRRLNFSLWSSLNVIKFTVCLWLTEE